MTMLTLQSDQETSTRYPDLLVAVHAWVHVCVHNECV